MNVKTKNGFFESEILVPAASAKVELVQNGKATKLTGHGYADHSRSKTMPKELAKGWVRFRKVGGKDPLLLLARDPPNGPVQGWLWLRPLEAKGELRIDRMQVREAPAKGGRAFRILMDTEGGPWRITSGTLLRRHAPIEEEGLLGRMVSSVIGNPVTYVYRAVLEAKGSSEKHEGILEVSFSDDKRAD